MTNIVTGAAGFIGSNVASELLRRGEKVIGIDNLNGYYDVQLKQKRLSELLLNKNFIFYELDIEDAGRIAEVFTAHHSSTVFHLAAQAGVRYSLENPFVYYHTNVLGTLNILEGMRKAKISKIIMASTSSLYAGQPLPFIESANVDMPISPYAASKRAAELLLYTYHLQYGLDVTILRYFTVYGPLGRPDMAPYRFAKWILEGRKIQIYGSGSHARDFTYIDDIVEGTILARKPLGYEIINLGGGKDPVSLLDFISAIEIVLEKKANLEFLEEKRGDMLLTQADISKAKTVLSWSPKVDVLAGIRLMCETKSDFIYSEDTI